MAWVVGNGSRRSDVGNSGLATAGLFSLTGAKARSLYCPRRTAGPYIWVKGRNFPKELNVAAYPTAADAHEMWRFGAVPGFGATVCDLAVMVSRLGWLARPKHHVCQIGLSAKPMAGMAKSGDGLVSDPASSFSIPSQESRIQAAHKVSWTRPRPPQLPISRNLKPIRDLRQPVHIGAGGGGFHSIRFRHSQWPGSS